VITAAERVGSTRPCASNPNRRATFQQVRLDAPRSALAHPTASVFSDLIVSVSMWVAKMVNNVMLSNKSQRVHVCLRPL
jgi:hypothetical protein